MAQPVAPRRHPWVGGAFPWTIVFLIVALGLFVFAGLIFFGVILDSSKAKIEDGLGCVAFGLAALSVANLRGGWA